ncbi:hypothetical protein P2318_07310 [Myxococcaceae bacterium GXIMD 01537]
MALIIRYRCHACGAHLDTTGKTAWLRCSFCQALIGYDWQAWFESPEYGQWLREYPSMMSKWGDYQRLVVEAAQAFLEGRTEETEAIYRKSVALQMTLTPHTYPPEVATDRAYRARYVRFDAWARLQTLVDPVMAVLDTELQQVCRGVDYRDAMPTLEKAIAILRKQTARLTSLAGAEDPDGMPPDARTRVVLSLFVNAYLPMLSREQRLAALRSVHGVNNVLEAGETTTDELGWYVDWSCPHCELASLQGRSSLELTCPGCFHRRPFSQDVLGLKAITMRCGSCGAGVALAEGEMETACGSCGAKTRRIARTGAVEQDHSRRIRDEVAAKHGLDVDELPAAGVSGFPVTEENRLELRLTGLARQAHWFARLIQAPRYVELVRRSFPEASDAARAALIQRVAEQVASEGGGDEARQLLAETRTRLLAGAPAR